ncbi:hypothetical protein ACIQTZ_22990 [Paenarthrobacter sp. NPDC090520]|uniref:hypothetical protein n=1 Tax=Paenarthrobacter sp. NPDC090520 TaxID=3364382 RepID=UPI0038243324
MSALLTTTQRVRAAAGNYLAAIRDTSRENHDAKNWITATDTISSGDIAKVTQVERSTVYVDTATGRLYKPATK